MERPICKTCPHWNEPEESDSELGDCRKRAPKPYLYDVDYNDSRANTWPQTLHDEWCGEHPGFPEYIASLKEPKQSNDTTRMTLELSREAADVLKHLADQTRDSEANVFRKALALYNVAQAAHREGKAVGVAASADGLETEFVGF